MASMAATESELNASGLFRIHPSFRMVALGEAGGDWLTEEVQKLFHVHQIRPLAQVHLDAFFLFSSSKKEGGNFKRESMEED